jgi:hypothetical protein
MSRGRGGERYEKAMDRAMESGIVSHISNPRSGASEPRYLEFPSCMSAKTLSQSTPEDIRTWIDAKILPLEAMAADLRREYRSLASERQSAKRLFTQSCLHWIDADIKALHHLRDGLLNRATGVWKATVWLQLNQELEQAGTASN